MHAKLRTVAASNNRDHARNLSYCCLLALHIWWCYSSRTSRSWWIIQSTQRHWRGCNNIPSFLQWTTPIARSLCEGWTLYDLHILVTAPFCCDRKSWAACAQSFVPWQQGTIEIMLAISLTVACSRYTYDWCYSSRTSRSWWIIQSTQRHRRGCNSTIVKQQGLCRV